MSKHPNPPEPPEATHNREVGSSSLPPATSIPPVVDTDSATGALGDTAGCQQKCQQSVLDRCIAIVRSRARYVAEGRSASLAVTYKLAAKTEGRAPRSAGESVLDNFERRLALCATDEERWRFVVDVVAEINQHRFGRPVAGISAEAWRARVAKEQAQREARRERHSDRRRALIEDRLKRGWTHQEIADEIGTTAASVRSEAKRIRDRANPPADGNTA